jgi:hypothetical protein
MKELTIEWRHYEKEGATCLRCSATGKTLEEVVAELRAELAPRGIRITFTETKLTEGQIPESNMILFNGTPLEGLLAGAEASENPCASCACLTDRETSCRTVEYEGKTYEEIPEELIRKAVSKVTGLNHG